jgi:hypothetical protein
MAPLSVDAHRDQPKLFYRGDILMDEIERKRFRSAGTSPHQRGFNMDQNQRPSPERLRAIAEKAEAFLASCHTLIADESNPDRKLGTARNVFAEAERLHEALGGWKGREVQKPSGWPEDVRRGLDDLRVHFGQLGEYWCLRPSESDGPWSWPPVKLPVFGAIRKHLPFRLDRRVRTELLPKITDAVATLRQHLPIADPGPDEPTAVEVEPGSGRVVLVRTRDGWNDGNGKPVKPLSPVNRDAVTQLMTALCEQTLPAETECAPDKAARPSDARLSLDDRAVVLFTRWSRQEVEGKRGRITLAELAGELGCHRGTLYDVNTCPALRNLWKGYRSKQLPRSQGRHTPRHHPKD